MSRRVAFVSGASRGIGAESAVALARAGFDVAITARTLDAGEAYDHVGKVAPLPGSLRATAAAVFRYPASSKIGEMDCAGAVKGVHPTLRKEPRQALCISNGSASEPTL